MLVDILNPVQRKAYITEIVLSNENQRRKEESFRRFEVFKGRIQPYLYKILFDEFDADTVNNMRTISSINFAKRIVEDKASVYASTPDRTFEGASESTSEVLGDIYKEGAFNVKLKKANQFYELMNQCILQLLPKNGKLKMRALAPHNLDAIPNQNDPDIADAYVLSAFNQDLYQKDPTPANKNMPSGRGTNISDGINQAIGDWDDSKLAKLRFVWWSKEHHFITDGNGEIINPETDAPDNLPEEMLENPLKEFDMMPFIDISEDKEYEFWVRYANSAVDFTLQMAVMMSDTVEINRLQGFAQPIVSSIDEPKNLRIGPNRILWLKKLADKEAGMQPTFEFATPSPNLLASLDMIKMFTSMYLSSEGQSPKLITASGEGESYSSGFDRYLSMFEKFEATQDSYDLFKHVELQLFDLVKAWLKILNPTDQLDKKYKVQVGDDVKLKVEFKTPEVLESKADMIDLLIKQVNAKLMSQKQAVEKIFKPESEEELNKILIEINSTAKSEGEDNGNREQKIGGDS